MRILITADLHYNHARSRTVADELIDRINDEKFDLLIVVGDTAVADGEALENCLQRFTFQGPKLFVAGNHELWTHSEDSYLIFKNILPTRVSQLGWHWLETDPYLIGDLGIVGSIGWYDYSFAQSNLGIPRRFYAEKISPGAAVRFPQYQPLLADTSDILPPAPDIIARWNDGKFVKLHRTDDQFLQEILDQLGRQLRSMASKKQVIACIHHLPFRELLPPPHSAQWDFAKAFLGSERLGELLKSFENVTHVFCGHSHLPMTAQIDRIHAVNIGSGYRHKTFEILEVDAR